MKWGISEPVSGDMVRVKAGNIYHFGIFVSDDEVIQFGLSPLLSVGCDAKNIEVISTNVDTFLQGEFLEVAIYDKKEIKRKRVVDEIVDNARLRLGEKGYNILYNNCEHFVNSCVFGESKSSQALKYKAVMDNFPFVDVYYATIPVKGKVSKVYPSERNNEILSTANPSLKLQKYYVWKLLEYATKESFKLKFNKLNFTKKENGQWICDKFYFSISHSGEVVAVSVSNYPTGIDVENLNKTRSLTVAKRVFHEAEQKEFDNLLEDERLNYFITKWTQKESEFKRLAKDKFSPKEIDTNNIISYSLNLGGENFMLSVSSENQGNPRIKKEVTLK